MEEKRPSLLNFIDPTQEFEDNIINRAKKQLEVSKTLDNVSNLMQSVGSHFMSIEDELNQLAQLLGELNVDLPFASVLASFSQMFNTWGKQFVSQSNLSLQVVNTIIIPSVTKLSENYTEVQQHYYKSIEAYGALDRKSKTEDLMQAENSFVKAATSRTGVLYSLDNQVSVCEKTAVNSVAIAISQFISLSANLMKQYLAENKQSIQITEESAKKMQSSVKHCLSQNINMQPDNNAATQASDLYWDIRFTPGTPATNEEFLKPNTTVWFRETHALNRVTWTRKTMSFKDCVLTLEKAPIPASTLQSLTNSDDPAASAPKVWALPLVTVTPTEKSRKNTFKIQSPQELIEIQALTKSDLDEWITIFTNHNFKMLGQDENASSKKRCCDCGASDATWCSVNWACDLCLKCSGVHRALSSSNSKVRSATLDKLHPMVINMMEKLQGDCNKLLLAVPHKEKIDTRTEESLRTIYITRKYINFEWSKQGVIPDPFKAILDHDIHALYYAAHFGRIEDQDDSLTPFHAACSIGDRDAVALLAYCVKDLNVRDRKGWTPLCYAVFFQYVDIIEFLLNVGADAKNVGINLYQLAIATKNMKVAKLILIAANSIRNDETEFQPVTLKYAPPGTPPDYKLSCKKKQ